MTEARSELTSEEIGEALAYLKKYHWNAQYADAVRTVDAAISSLKRAEEKADQEMLRVKACEHIADGDEGWEKLRNLCPSTAAVARLRDRLSVSPFLVCQECRHLIGCVQRRQCRRSLSPKDKNECAHEWSDWVPVLGGRGYHVECKCSKCGEEQYDD